jgi:tripartite-type tricarboxylate transporter receptor subunit TctC|tara:strand:- start:54 stop:1004 length:951 start_codon:yes stop_codon:yes gene_type:complete
MKNIIKIGIAALGLLAIASGSFASGWNPPGPIKLLIAFKAGGGADTQARMIAEELETKLGWKFIPQQVTGKGGVNMLKALSEMPNDGTAIGMAVTEALGYNLAVANAGLEASDFTGLSTTAGFQLAIVGRSSDGYKTMHDVIAAAKAGKEIRLATMSPRLSDIVFLMEEANGVKFNVVAYKGGKAALDAINAGDVDVGFVAGPQAKGVAAGDLVELASALSKPLTATPDAPLLSDLGVPFNGDGYFVFVGPGGMPAEAQLALGNAVASVVTDQEAKITKIINKVFGGAVTIKGPELDTFLQNGYAGAAVLQKAVSE